jgi:molybdate/tungstate transport system substrate-binding protein
VAVFDALTTGAYLADSGFVLRDQFPMYEGDPPDRVREATRRAGPEQSVEGSPPRPLAGTVSDLTVLI